MQHSGFGRCGSSQPCALPMSVNKILITTFACWTQPEFYDQVHLFLSQIHQRERFTQTSSSSVPTRTVYWKQGWGEADFEIGSLEIRQGSVIRNLPELLIVFAFLCFSDRFHFVYLLQDSEIFPVLYILTPSLPHLLTSFFYTETFTERCETRTFQR